jgi:hypothetical protein
MAVREYARGYALKARVLNSELLNTNPSRK